MKAYYDPAESLEQALRASLTRQVEVFCIWVFPCFISEHGVNRDAGYLAFDMNSGGYPYTSQFGHSVYFYPSHQDAQKAAAYWASFLVGGYEVHSFTVNKFERKRG